MEPAKLFLTAYSICRSLIEPSSTPSVTESFRILAIDYLKTDPFLPASSFPAPSSSCPSCPSMACVSKSTLSMTRIKVYPATNKKNGILSRPAKSVSSPHLVLTYCMHSHSWVYSGKICKKAIAKNTPPLKALATPSTIGDSLNLFDLIGMDPIIAASNKATMIKIILIVLALHIIS